MVKTPLSFYSSYYIDSKVDPSAVTNYGGLFPYLDLMLLSHLPKLAQECLGGHNQRGWHPAEHIAALLALNLTGGDCVDDLEKLESDAGISLYMGQIARALGIEKRRFTRGGARSIPSLTSIREWLDQFHNGEEEAHRGYGEAYVPSANEALRGLRSLNREFVTGAFDLYKRSGRGEVGRATLEIDATYIETQKRDALRCYKQFNAYSGLTVRWCETGLVIRDEFRDGNVPAGYRNREALEEAILHLNTELGITDIWVRSDAAAHQETVLKMLSEWSGAPIKFAIGYKKTKEFRAEVKRREDAVWERVCDGKGRLLYEVTEVPFVSNSEALIKAAPYRHIVVRRRTKQGVLPGFTLSRDGEMGDEEWMEIDGHAYRVWAIITNIGEEWSNREVVDWYTQRCGGGEAIHSVIKSDLAGGQLPSNKFGANAGWWSLVILSHNLHALLEKLALPKGLVGSRFKRLRYHLINVPARLVHHARRCCVRYFQESVRCIVQFVRGELNGLAAGGG